MKVAARFIWRLPVRGPFRRAMRDARVSRSLGAKPRPTPVAFVDVTTGVLNGPITPGRPGRLVGENLRYDVTDPAQGIFFIKTADGAATRVEELVWGQPAHLAFMIPTLPAGEYKVEVRAVLNGNHDLREGRLDNVLTVS